VVSPLTEVTGVGLLLLFFEQADKANKPSM
jgi:hypothetical protein